QQAGRVFHQCRRPHGFVSVRHRQRPLGKAGNAARLERLRWMADALLVRWHAAAGFAPGLQRTRGLLDLSRFGWKTKATYVFSIGKHPAGHASGFATGTLQEFRWHRDQRVRLDARKPAARWLG